MGTVKAIIHGQRPSPITQGILSNEEAGFMGPQAQFHSVMGIHPLHLISQAKKAKSHWDLSTTRSLMPRGSHGEGQGRDGFSLPEDTLSLEHLDPGEGEFMSQSR